jgi:hypothetical protein
MRPRTEFGSAQHTTAQHAKAWPSIHECTNARIKDACGRAMSDGYGAGRSSRADYRGPRENWPEIGLADTWFDGAVPLARDGGTNQPLRTALTATLQTHNQPRPPRAPYRGYLTGSAAS